jgi:hypothetical protein
MAHCRRTALCGRVHSMWCGCPLRSWDLGKVRACVNTRSTPTSEWCIVRHSVDGLILALRTSRLTFVACSHKHIHASLPFCFYRPLLRGCVSYGWLIIAVFCTEGIFGLTYQHPLHAFMPCLFTRAVHSAYGGSRLVGMGGMTLALSVHRTNGAILVRLGLALRSILCARRVCVCVVYVRLPVLLWKYSLCALHLPFCGWD